MKPVAESSLILASIRGYLEFTMTEFRRHKNNGSRFQKNKVE
jgi:hypothetical protein